MAVIQARNPRTGKQDYEFVAADAGTVSHAVANARTAQRDWYRKGLDHRVQALTSWAKALEARADAITAALADDTGRTRISREELGAVIHFIHGYSDAAPEVLAQPFRKFSNNSDVVFKTTLIPYPVVGVISPWNFPLVLSFIDAIPALLAGAAVVIKPSEVTPRFVVPLQESINDVPELKGVITLLRGLLVFSAISDGTKS